MPYYPVEWSEKVLMGIWDSYAKENHFFFASTYSEIDS